MWITANQLIENLTNNAYAKGGRAYAKGGRAFRSLSITELNNEQLKKILELLQKNGLSNVIRVLDISHNQLTTLPDSIESLVELQELDVSHNQLSTLPDSIGNLARLKRLYVYVNQLTELPNSIGHLTRLQSLNVPHNELTALPDSIGNLVRLKRLDAAFNRLKALPDSMGNLVELQWLNVCKNQLTFRSPKTVNGFRMEWHKLQDAYRRDIVLTSELKKLIPIELIKIVNNYDYDTAYRRLSGCSRNILKNSIDEIKAVTEISRSSSESSSSSLLFSTTTYHPRIISTWTIINPTVHSAAVAPAVPVAPASVVISTAEQRRRKVCPRFCSVM